MELENILGGLTPAERSIIDEMQKLGWVGLTDCRVEDGREIGGDGFRSYKHEGRHDIVLVLPRVSGRAGMVENDAEPRKKKR